MTNDLLHSPARITRTLLIALGVGTAWSSTSSDWPVSYSSEVDRPDETVTVYDTQGTDEGSAHSEVQGHYGIQVRVRARDYETGWTKASEIFQGLQSTYYSYVTLDETIYAIQCYSRFGSIIPLGRARNSTNVVFTLNVLMMVHNAGTTGIPTGGLQSPDDLDLEDPDGNFIQEAA